MVYGRSRHGRAMHGGTTNRRGRRTAPGTTSAGDTRLQQGWHGQPHSSSAARHGRQHWLAKDVAMTAVYV